MSLIDKLLTLTSTGNTLTDILKNFIAPHTFIGSNCVRPL